MRPRGDDGNGVVEFVLVTALVLFLFLLVVQVGLVLHARNVLVAAAAEGARYGANADRTDAQGAARAAQVAADALPGVAGSARASAVPRDPAASPQVVDIALTADLPVLFAELGQFRLTVHGHALEEGA